MTRRPSTVSIFSSKRERRLWAWTLAVVVAIYSTLGLAQTLAKAVDDSSFGVGLFLLGCLLVLTAVVTQGLKTRPSGIEIGVALGVAAAYLLVFVRMAIPTERSHIVEYGVVALFIYEALSERARVAASLHRPCSPSWQRHWSDCSMNASRRFCPAACSTPKTSSSTSWRP